MTTHYPPTAIDLHDVMHGDEKGVKTNSLMTARKTAGILSDNLARVITGFVVLNTLTGDRHIVEIGGVRHISNEDFQAIMHPRQQS